MSQISIAQALSGYDEGHRILATGGDVSDAERALVDRLSDLSGYLPIDTTFSSYWTGYPCHRYYALACTWPDVGAKRSGTVLTHTLLAPRGAFAGLEDPAIVASAFRRPASAADRAFYEAPIDYVLPANAKTAQAVVDDRSRAVAALWFGQSVRPILWMEEAEATDVLRALWRMLWPEARANLAFCTFALGVRKLRGRRFDFLALPPAAKASFHELGRSSAWYEHGVLPDPGAQHAFKDAWTSELVEAGATLFEPVLSLCREHKLPIPAPWKMRDALRFLRLANGSSRNALNAARARADLLFWIWEDIPSTQPLTRTILRSLLAELPAAPLESRTFRELQDFVTRKAVVELGTADASFAAEVSAMLGKETTRRFQAVPIAEAELTKFLQGCGLETWRDAVVHAGFSASADKAELAISLILFSSRSEKAHWIEAGIPALQEDLRSEAVKAASQKLDPEQATWLWKVTLNVALALSDLPLVLAAVAALDEPGTSTERVVALAREKQADFATLARHISPERLLAIALEGAIEDTWRVRLGVDAASAIAGGLNELAARCARALFRPDGTAAAAPLVFAGAGKSESRTVIEQALHGREALAFELVRQGIQGRDIATGVFESALSVTFDACPSMEGVLEELEHASGSGWVRVTVAWFLPRVIEQLRKKATTPGVAARWFALPAMRDHVTRAGDHELFRECPHGLRGELLGSLTAAVRQSLAIRAQPADWIGKLIPPIVLAASAQQLEEATQGLAAILDLSMDLASREVLAIAFLEAVRSKPTPTGWRLVERAFPIVYPALVQRCQSRPSSWLSLFWPAPSTWDKAKPWRHWLLDQWIRAEWPAVSFLRALGGDQGLFRRMVARMARRQEGRRFLQRLHREVAADPAIEEVWGGVVRWAADHPDDPVDYD